MAITTPKITVILKCCEVVVLTKKNTDLILAAWTLFVIHSIDSANGEKSLILETSVYKSITLAIPQAAAGDS